MPRPPSLRNLASGAQSGSDYHQLTPRTPYSRTTGRGFDAQHNGPLARQQSEPLLASSGTDAYSNINLRTPTIPRTKSGSQKRERYGLLGCIPLVLGILTAAGLLILLVLSWQQPERLYEVLFGEGFLGITKLSFESAIVSTPLRPPTEYVKECAQLNAKPMSHGDYWDPMSMSALDTKSAHGRVSGGQVCNSTIIYMLDGTVGLMTDLAIMAQVAAFARERNKTFFVGDANWNRGRWSDHFEDVGMTQPSPQGQPCVAPPLEDVVACPRSSPHWLVTSRTAKYHLGHRFYDHYENPYARGLNRLKPIFQQVAASFAQTIRPNEKTRAIIAVVQKEFTAWLMTRPWNPRADRYLGVHIRRGDRLGSSWRYHDKHIPTEVYAQAAQMAWARNVSSTVPTSTDAYQQPAIYLASDDQTLHEELEESLSSGIVFSLARSTLPALKDLASPRPYVQAEFNALPEEERIRQTRGMLADFAMISGMWTRLDSLKPDAVVCAMSSVVCDSTAYAFGWEKAFGLYDGDRDDDSMDAARKAWIEIDNAGAVVPAWDPFRLF